MASPCRSRSGGAADEDAAIIWIIDNQKGRRNVEPIDRINLARRRAEIVAKKAKANQKAAAENRRDSKGRLSPKSANLPDQVNTRKEAAKAAGVGERTYDAACSHVFFFALI